MKDLTPLHYFPSSFEDYDIEILDVIPDKIGAMQSVTIPYRITKRVQTAANTSLATEVCGYGGSDCTKTFSITIAGKCVICPNSEYQRVAEKVANFLISALSNTGCGSTGNGGTSSGQWMILNPTCPGCASGFGFPPPAPASIKTSPCGSGCPVTVYDCFRPLSDPLLWGLTYHRYVWIDASFGGWGLTTADGKPHFSYPGALESDNATSGWGVHCTPVQVTECQKQCLETEITKDRKNPPDYDLVKFNCHHWVSNIFSRCPSQ